MNKLMEIYNNLTTPPKHYVLAAKELESAKRSYLENKTQAEYYSTLCSFETQRIKRLEQYLGVTDHS
jgi:hypothetical protein